MKTFMKDLVTESDNETYDYNRVLVILFALLVIFITLGIISRR